MLRRLLGLVVLLGCALLALAWLSAWLPVLPVYAWPLALVLWLTLRRYRRGPSALGSERQIGGDANA